MSESLSLVDRVGQAASEALAIKTNRPLSDIPLTPDPDQFFPMQDQYMAFLWAGYRPEELIHYPSARARPNGSFVVEPDELSQLLPTLHGLQIKPNGLLRVLREEQLRARAALDMGAHAVDYGVGLGVHEGFTFEVRAVRAYPKGLYVTALGYAAIESQIDPIPECIQHDLGGWGVPADRGALGEAIHHWNGDPRHNGLPKLPLPLGVKLPV